MSHTPTVLVTGAAGFAGSHLLDALIRPDCRIVAVRHPVVGADVQARYPAVEWIGLDLLDRAAVERAVAACKPDVVYHLAGAAHVGQSWDASTDTLAINVMATHHVFEALRAAGVKPRVVIPSSAYVYRAADRALGEERDSDFFLLMRAWQEAESKGYELELTANPIPSQRNSGTLRRRGLLRSRFPVRRSTAG